MTVYGMNMTSQDPTYTWADLKPTHRIYPDFWTDICAQVEEAWAEYQLLTDIEPLPHMELELQLTKCRDLERRKDRAWKAMQEGNDPETDDVPFKVER